MRWWAVAVVIALLASTRAAAQDRVHFSWRAPDGTCPPASQLVAETEQALGPATATGTSEPPLAVDAIVSRRSHGRLQLTLVMHFPAGEAARSIDASDCASLVHAAALVVALAMQPESAPEPDAGAPPPDLDAGVPPTTDAGTTPVPAEDGGPAPTLDGGTSAPTTDEGTGANDGGATATDVDAGVPADAGPPRADGGAPPADAGPTRTDAGAAERAPSARPPWSFEAVVEALLDVGTLPNVAPGILAGLGVRYDDLHVEALFLDLPTGDGNVPGDATRGGHFGFVGGRLAAALDVLHLGTFALAPAAAVELGSLSGIGFGVSTPLPGSVPFALAALGARATITLGPVVLRLDVEGYAPFQRRPFTLDGVAVYTPLPVGFRAAFGLGIHFP